MAALMVPENPTEIIQRPDPPLDLTDEQSDEWRAVVNTMPADHFMRGNYPLLSQLCRHIVSSRRIAQLIEQVAKEKVLDRKELSALLQLQAAESAAIMRLSRSMRLTQQSIMGQRRPSTLRDKRNAHGIGKSEALYAAMKLRLSAWAPLRNLADINHGLMLPILFHCVDDQGRPTLGTPRQGLETEQFRRTAYKDIPAVVEEMRQYWMPTRFQTRA